MVGDRLTTDVMMANLMGSYAVWVKDGVLALEEKSVVSISEIFFFFFFAMTYLMIRMQFSRLEQRVASFLVQRGYKPPEPISPFEK